MSALKSIEELGREIGVPYYRIAYVHRTGKVPEPIRLNGRRYYDADCERQVREHFERQLAEKVLSLQKVSK